jgi:hypothetical protein
MVSALLKVYLHPCFDLGLLESWAFGEKPPFLAADRTDVVLFDAHLCR